MAAMKHSRKRQPRPQGPEEPPRGIYILPNIFTTLNLMFGFYSIIAGIQGRFLHAALAIFLAAVFDGLDGRIARMTGTTSRFGVEYDSLADLISFGLAPGLLLYNYFLNDFKRLGWLAAFLYVACAALRLARFNLQHAKEEKTTFTGLPSPGGAGMATSLTLFDLMGGFGDWDAGVLALLVAYILAFLMISTIPFRSLKTFDLKRPRSFQVLVASTLMLVVLALYQEVFLMVFFSLYTLSGPVESLFGHLTRKKRTTETTSVEG